eukprot:gene19857-26551_t
MAFSLCSTSNISQHATRTRPVSVGARPVSLRRSVVVCATDQAKEEARTGLPQIPPIESKSEEDMVRLRAEAEAPFRSVRMGIYGLGALSSGIGFLVSIPQLIGALGGARAALPLEQIGQNIGINLVVGIISGYLLKGEFDGQAKQFARLTREEKLASLSIQLANGRTLRMGKLRGTSRCVIVAGTPEQVAASMEAAEPYKDALKERGVFCLCLCLVGATRVPLSPSCEGDKEPGVLPEVAEEDLRWVANPVRLADWDDWFETQLKFSSKAKVDTGLFVGLRLDGRVRSSGMGLPPWERYSLELAPLEGEKGWTGFMDGFDGTVN